MRSSLPGCVAVADDIEAASAAQRREGGEFGAVGIQNRGPARAQQLAEQPPFRRAIRFHVAVIVEMVARQVRESRRRRRNAVEPVLRETVARRLDRDMLDAVAGQFRQIAVQRDRVGRRQRAGTPSRSGDTRPSVPRLAAGCPSPVQISRVKCATDVLPLVPVTAAIVFGWRP